MLDGAENNMFDTAQDREASKTTGCSRVLLVN